MTSVPEQGGNAPDRIAGILRQFEGKDGALLPILHEVQALFGYIPPDVQPRIASALGISNAEVHGVVTFYHDFRQAPAGHHVVKLCRAEACQAMGADRLAALVQDRLGIGWHETPSDGRVTLEPVVCLGLCACAPAAMGDGQLMARLEVDRLVEALGGGA